MLSLHAACLGLGCGGTKVFLRQPKEVLPLGSVWKKTPVEDIQAAPYPDAQTTLNSETSQLNEVVTQSLTSSPAPFKEK